MNHALDPAERRDLFHKAADLLEKEAWVTGEMFNDNPDTPAYCMVGAIRQVAWGDPYESESRAPYADEKWAGISIDVMTEWNDGHAETVEAVVQRLREMAAGKHLDEEEWRNEVYGD